MHQELLDLLLALDGIRQDPRYHPEGDALFHSLQAFDIARRETADRTLWAAALLHDVGKAVSSPDHDEVGADLLDGLVSPRIVWLVRHHLDLLRVPGGRGPG
jgi:exopolyphosphatase/pppGpp-phosphohydrolase